MTGSDIKRRFLARMDEVVADALGRLDAQTYVNEAAAAGTPAATPFLALAAASGEPQATHRRITQDRSIHLTLRDDNERTLIDVRCQGHPTIQRWGGRAASLLFRQPGLTVGITFSRGGHAEAVVDVSIARLSAGEIDLVDGGGED